MLRVTRWECFVCIVASAEKQQVLRSPTPPRQKRARRGPRMTNLLMTDLQHNFAVVLAFLHERVGGAGFGQRENSSDYGIEFAGGDPFGELFPGRFHERAICAEITQPETVDARSEERRVGKSVD